MHHRTPRALAAAVALAIASGACSDVPTSAPARIASAGPARTVSASGATLIPNTVKYRDTGGKPATGRSGSAALRAYALLGKDGVTDLTLEALSADPNQWWKTGIIQRAQIRALSVDGSQTFIRNLTGTDERYQQLRLGTLMRGQSLRVQANVTGIDPHRTDVVTVTERVKRRPDIAATIEIGPQVPAFQPVPIHATVRELNGDVGAYTDCWLWVDGVLRDYALGVWVDAGDAITCAFTQLLLPGTHTLQVEVRDPIPADWDNSNNSTPVVQVEAVGDLTEFGYNAQARAGHSQSVFRDEVTWYNHVEGTRGVDRVESSHSAATESSHMDGWLGRGISGPVSLTISQSSGGKQVHSDAWTVESVENGCTSRSTGGASFFLCSAGSGYGGITVFNYDRAAGSVTYHSSWYSRAWDDVTGEELYFYHSNEPFFEEYGPLAGYGDDYAFDVRVTAGDVVLTAESLFPLEHFENSYGSSGCTDWEDAVYRVHSCLLVDSKSSSLSGGDSRS